MIALMMLMSAVLAHTGDYAGWAYKPGADDFPLRLHVSGAEPPVVTLDLPAAKAGGLPTEGARRTPAGLEFSRTSKAGKTWRFHLSDQEGGLRGAVEIDNATYYVHLHRAESALPWVDPAQLESLQGIYSDGRGCSVRVLSWPWGDLRMVETVSGRVGTLFPVSDSEFVLGPAEYVAAPVWGRAKFTRNSAGEASELRWSAQGGPERLLQRLPARTVPFEVDNAGTKIKGSLLTPQGPGPWPAVVVVGGSDWKTREDLSLDAGWFLGNGLAVLTCDNRGYGESGGELPASFEQIASDIRACVRELARNPEISAAQIGLSGRSRGGWLAPLAASVCPEVRFLVLFVPSALSPAAQETTRRLNLMRAAGKSEAEVTEGKQYLQKQFVAGTSQSAWVEYDTARAEMEKRGWLEWLLDLGEKGSEDEKWVHLNMMYNPVPVLEKITCPVLVIWGGRDRNVVPEENLPPMRAALERAGNRSVQFEVLEGADHGLRLEPAGQAQAPMHLRTRVYAPAQFSLLRDWLTKQGLIRAP